MPAWFLELDSVHWLRSKLEKLFERPNGIHKVRILTKLSAFCRNRIDQAVKRIWIWGKVLQRPTYCTEKPPVPNIEEMRSGFKDDKDLLRVLKEYTAAKVDALYQVERVGCGIVPGEMILRN